MLLSVILEDEDNLFSMPDEKRKELIRRSNVCLYVEEAIVKLGEALCDIALVLIFYHENLLINLGL